MSMRLYCRACHRDDAILVLTQAVGVMQQGLKMKSFRAGKRGSFLSGSPAVMAHWL